MDAIVKAGNANPDWQTLNNVLECNRYMLDRQQHCDVQFIVKGKAIGAHKYMLVCRSPVFEAMFFGSLFPKENEPIVIPDIDSSEFESLLRYIYYEDDNVTMDNALGILYASKKYMVYGLGEKCVEVLIDNLQPSNVCEIYESGLLHEEKRLIRKCALFIETRTQDILKSNSFVDLPHQCLIRLLKFNKLSVDELSLFQACLNWSTEECKRQNMSVTADNQRKLLGEALFLLRLPTLPLQDFAKKVSHSGLLSAEEKCSIYEFMVCGEKSDLSHLPFPIQFREQPKPAILRRFGAYCKTSVYSGDCNILKLQIDHTIILKALGVSGSVSHDPLGEIQLIIREDNCVSFELSITALQKDIRDIVHFNIPETVLLKKTVWYTFILTFHFLGDNHQGICKRGKDGSKTVVVDGVTFEFDRADSAGFLVDILFCKS